MTDEDEDLIMVENIRRAGYEAPDLLMQKRVEAFLGVTAPLWRAAPPLRRELMLMQTHRALIAADQAEASNTDVTPKFLKRSARAAINALRGLEQTAIMLETWAPKVFPEVNEQGQKHFGRVMMESAAESIRQAWANAIAEVCAKPNDTLARISDPSGEPIVAEPYSGQ